jgi:hypothetical protein
MAKVELEKTKCSILTVTILWASVELPFELLAALHHETVTIMANASAFGH